MEPELLEKAVEDMTKAASEGLSALNAKIESEGKEREELERKFNRLALGSGGGGESEKRELKAIGDAFRTYIKAGDIEPLKEFIETKDMSVSSDPEGGYSVYPAFSSEITRRIFEISPIRQHTRIVRISTDAFEELVDLNEPDAGWVGEKQGRPDTNTPDIGKFRIPACEIYAMPKVTQKLLDDSAIDIGAWLVDKISLRFARMEGAAFVAGSGGPLQPRGFLDYEAVAQDDESRSWEKLQYVPTGAAAGFKATDSADALIDLQAELKPGYRPNAIWVMNRRTAATVRKFKDAEGRYVWQDALTAALPPMLLGHPVVLAEDMPGVGTNTFPVAFGDFRAGYTIVDRHGERVLRDPYTDKPNVRFYAYRRVGGDVNNFEAIKLLKCATS